MQKHSTIKALFFLGIFSILLLHQVVPHWHHENDNGHTHKTVAHNKAHNHQHDVPEKENSNKGLLDLFLELHIHSIVFNELLLPYESAIKQLEVKKLSVTSATVIQNNSSFNDYETEKIKVYQPPNTYFNSYLLSLDLRGPPSLG